MFGEGAHHGFLKIYIDRIDGHNVGASNNMHSEEYIENDNSSIESDSTLTFMTLKVILISHP